MSVHVVRLSWNPAVQAQLKKTEIDVQQMIQDRETKVEEIKHCVELNKVSLFYKHMTAWCLLEVHPDPSRYTHIKYGLSSTWKILKLSS